MTNLQQRLFSEARRLAAHQTRHEFLAQGLFGSALAAVVASVAFLVDRFAPLPAVVRVFLVLLAGGILSASLIRAYLARRSAMRDPEAGARSTEREAVELRERLVPALQMVQEHGIEKTGYSTDLIQVFAEDVADRAGAVRPETLPYNARTRRMGKLALGGAGLLAATCFTLGADSVRGGLFRFASAFAEVGPAPRASFSVDPGSRKVARGSDLRLAALVSRGERTGLEAYRDEDTVLETRKAEKEPWQALSLDRGDSLVYVVPAVDESFDYRFRVGRERSETFRIEALDPPHARVESVRYAYPEYTGLAARTIEDGGGDIAAVKGTHAEVFVESSSPPQEAALVLGSGANLPLQPQGEPRRLSTSIALQQDDVYRVEMVDALGVRNADPLEYKIRALPDEPPFIRLLEPNEDKNLDESLRATLRWSALDDYGLGAVHLKFETSRNPGESSQHVLFTPKQRTPETSSTFDWDLSSLDLLPGDSVTYFLETRDNNAVDGPSTSRTRSYVLRFPSLGEIYEEIEEGQESSIDEMKEVAEEIEKVGEKMEKVGREILKQGESSWESRQEMQKALETQQQMSSELQKIQEQVNESMQALMESEFMSFEALQKMEQLQKLLDEVTTQEMKEALEKLRDAMNEQQNGRQDEKFEDFQKSQEELMKSLDRVMENLKQFRLEEKMKAAVRQLEELAARQERVNDDHSKLSPPSEKEQKEKSGDEQSGEDPQGEEDSKEDGDEASKEKASAKDEASAEAKKEKSSDESAENDDSDKSAEGEDSEKDSSKGGKEEKSANDAKKGKEKDPSATESKESGDKTSSEDGAKTDPGDEETPSKEKSGDRGEKPGQKKSDRKRLAEEEKTLAEQTKKLEEELRELSKMVKELRDTQDREGMEKIAKEMQSKGVPQTMDEMSKNMDQGNDNEAKDDGEKALTELRETLASLMSQQSSMSMRMIAISQAAINRAVRDLLSLSTDEESLTQNLEVIPRNTMSATRAYTEEQRRLLQGAERVDHMLEEVAKGTPLMESAVGKTLEKGMEAMKDAAYGLESGAVQMANESGEEAVQDLNAVVIQLIRTVQSMSSCSSGSPMSSMMQQMQQLSEDQQQLNQMMQQLRDEMKGGKSRRLQGSLPSFAEQQARIQQELEKVLGEIGEGGGLLGKLDDVSKRLEDAAKRMQAGQVDDQLLRDQEWALTRLLDSQRSIRERDFGKERRSETAKELGELPSPSELPEGLEGVDRDLREDLLKALERRYPPQYEDLIKRYFRSLTREESATPLP